MTKCAVGLLKAIDYKAMAGTGRAFNEVFSIAFPFTSFHYITPPFSSLPFSLIRLSLA